jgi:general L-amino acid transport system substrate-binding protein
VEGAPTIGTTASVSGATLRAIRSRGYLICGVHQGLLGFAYTDNKGQWRGFDVEFCRATAAAILGSATAVRFIPTSSTERLTVLQAGDIDVLWRNTTGTFSRETAMNSVGVNYYDGQGFMVRRALGIASARGFDGARICIQTGSTNEMNLTDYFRAQGLRYEPVVFDTEDKGRSAYDREQCDAYTADVSNLAAARASMNEPAAHVILPEIISKEPLGPVVRHGDEQWADIVRWTLNAMILAEEFGITSRTVDRVRQSSTNPELRRLLGMEGSYGRMLGLSDDWAYQVIKLVGSYSEAFERNLGSRTPLHLERGLNALWNAPKPGLLYAPPMR